MPYRPTAQYRRNIKGVIYPLTAAVALTFGIRRDGGYPIGAFYTVNIDAGIWRPAGGIWYVPINPNKISSRNIREEAIFDFCGSISDGRNVILQSGSVITWEVIPDTEAIQLPQL